MVQNDSPHTEHLSEELLYWAGKKVEGDPSPGLYLSSGTTALRDTGQPHADIWPYDDERDEMAGYDPPPEAGCLDSYFRRASLESVPMSGKIKALLRKKILSVITLPISSSFFSPPNGLVSLPNPGESLGDSHAVVLVGYDDGVGDGAFIFRNSWGDEWGEAGYGFLPYDYVDMYGDAGCHLKENIRV